MDKLQKLNAKYIELVASWYSDPDAKLVAGTDSKTGYLFASDGHRAILLPDHPFDVDRNELKIVYDLVNSRYLNNLTTIFSSEYSVKEITDIDTATGSRIYDMVKPYGMLVTGANERLRG